MEETVLTTFCVASELRNAAKRPGIPPLLKKCADIVEARLRVSTAAADLEVEEALPVPNPGKVRIVPTRRAKTRGGLDEDIAEVFASSGLTSDVLEISSYSIGDRKFSPRRVSPSQSLVYAPVGPDGGHGPGVIRQIFEYAGKTYFVIHRYGHQVPSYFDRYPDFGASIWTSNTDPVPQILEASSRIYAANQRPWSEGQIVFRPLIDVSLVSAFSAR